MEKKRLFQITSLITLSLSLVGALFIKTKPELALKVNSNQPAYTFTLDSSNNGFLPTSAGSGQSNESNSPRTSLGNQITFAYSSAYRYSVYAARINKNTGGYIANVTPFTGLRSISINVSSGNVTLSLGSSYSSYGDPISVTSGMSYEVEANDYFKISVGSATAYISSITVEYVCDGDASLSPIMDHVHHGYHYLAKEPTQDKAGNAEFYACNECRYVSLVKEDDGEYVDRVLTYELPSTHIAYIAPIYKLRNDLLRSPAQFAYPIAVNLEETCYENENGQHDRRGRPVLYSCMRRRDHGLDPFDSGVRAGRRRGRDRIPPDQQHGTHDHRGQLLPDEGRGVRQAVRGRDPARRDPVRAGVFLQDHLPAEMEHRRVQGDDPAVVARGGRRDPRRRDRLPARRLHRGAPLQYRGGVRGAGRLGRGACVQRTPGTA